MRVEEERMKESWMYKLIDLRWNKLIKPLEEYLLELAKRNPLYTNFNINLPWVSILWVHETILISKKFWFIQRLLEHDKIDFTKLEDNNDYLVMKENWANTYNDLLMLLSIQDDPIEFLIGILK